MPNELNFWIRSKPGPFAARTQEAVWDMAWANFSKDHPSSIDGDFLFRGHLMDEGFNIRHLIIGGYALDLMK